jgi:hypothetical protein
VKWMALGLIAVFLSASSSGASGATPAPELAIGEQLSPLKGEFLSGRTAVLPQAASGRVALLLLGFTHSSRFAVEAWTKKFRQDFSTEPRVTYFEVPIIGGMGTMARWFINSGMRRDTPKADYENVITVYGGADLWKQRVGFGDPNAAYLILIDQSGKVAWRHAGNVDEDSYQALSLQLKKLLAGK